ncbi:TonB-dependent receptor [Novosphingobium naphthalenivorans]|uniref:TonB-dependent receptor n=1 Tax=Novosphingobium naphthalenivorans TaxID=273168 RepID=UPI000A8422D7|nr:TonB-dependent receptor [Novosphingobium naphthalenivorans]
MRIKAVSLCLSTCVFALAAATPAFAEDASGASSAAVADDAAAGEGLNQIVVTATKRETNLQKTPIAISVVDPTMLKDRHIQSLIDLADGSVPTLRVATFEARQSALTVGIRGIVPFDQNQTARDTGVGVYIDGVYLGRSQGLNAALFDVDRIEVLEGPQGTLFGRNTEGGAVSIVTKQPTGEFGGRMSAGVGNYGSYTGQLHLNLPEVYNVSVKVDGLMQHQDATVKDPLAGQTGWNYHNDVGGRITAKWEPIKGFSATFAYDKAKDENTPNFSQLINYNPLNENVGTYTGGILTYNGSACNKTTNVCIAPLSPLITPTGGKRLKTAQVGVPQQPSVDATSGFSANLKWEVAPSIELRSITAWRQVTTDQWDNSGGPARTIYAPNTPFSRYSLSHLSQRQFSQEFQVVGSLPHLDYVAGLYYFTEYAHELAATPASNTWNADGTGYSINSELVTGTITSSNNGWDRDSWFVQRDSNATAHSYAAFAQATWSPIDVLHLTVGGRYTKDKRHGALTMVSGVDTPWTFTYNKGRFDPMVTLAWDATQDVNLYAKYATGYRAGGANDRSATFLAFGPEKVKSYEVGAKMDFLDHHVRLNLAGYIMDRTGTQTDFDNVDTNPYLPDGVTPNPTFNLHTENTANAPGTSKIRGVEAQLTVRPVDNVTMGLSYAYTHITVPATPNPNLGGALYQVYTVYTPENAASGYIDYDVPVSANGMTLRAHIDGNYSDPVYSFQNESTRTDKSFVVNGSIALADIPMGEGGQKLTVSAWSRNLLNTTYIYRRSAANDKVLGDYGNFNPPRTFGLEAQVAF